MNFDRKQGELMRLLQRMPHLEKMLSSIDSEPDRVAEDPAKRIVLPYAGPRPQKGPKWLGKN